MAVELGKKYRDKLLGFEGVATARTTYVAGCARVCLQTMREGKIEDNWFDETLLEDVKLSPEEDKPGGPGAVAPSRDPVRRSACGGSSRGRAADF